MIGTYHGFSPTLNLFKEYFYLLINQRHVFLGFLLGYSPYVRN